MKASTSKSADMAARKPQTAPLRIGIMGGSFDPVHYGHLRLIRLARRRFALDRVYLLPARRPWHKRAPMADFDHRFAMLALAVVGWDWALPAALPDWRRPTYTWDELAWTRQRHPEAQVFFLLGADAFRDLPHWHHFPQLLDRCDWIVAHRGQASLNSSIIPANRLREVWHGGLRLRRSRVWWLPRFHQPFSSRRLRRLLAQAHPAAEIRQAMPARVVEYAVRARLYRAKNR